MHASIRSLLGVGVVVAAVLSTTTGAVAHVGVSGSAAVTIPAFQTSDLTATPMDNWITQEGNLAGNRYSGLTDISPSNVTGLKQAWHVTLKSSVAEPPNALGGEAPQLEYDGTVFAEDQFGRVYARNATTGAAVWLYEPHNAKLSVPKVAQTGTDNPLHVKVTGPTAASRGLAMNDGTIYAEEGSGRMVALDATSGKQLWATQIGDSAHGTSLSAAPVYYDGMILGGTSGGDTGGTCIAFALNAATGKMLWTFNVIPQKAGDPGYSTWTHPLAYAGGGAIWSAATVDPTNGLVYFGTGNPIPFIGSLRGPGSNEFTSGVLALHADTGKLAWFFQEVHHDLWDTDQSQQPVLTTVNYKGQTQDAIVSANKDGLWYVLNPDTGKPIIPVTETKVQQSTESHTYATQPIPATESLIPENVPDRAKWKGLVAANGKPYNIGTGGPAGEFVAVDSENYSVSAAGPGQGASGNKPASFDPTTGLMIEETTPGFSDFEQPAVSEVPKINFFNFGASIDYDLSSLNGTPAAASGTELEAINPSTGKIVWKDYRETATTGAALATATPFLGGVLTSNGIVWTNAGAHLQALSEKTGQLLWTSPKLVGASDSPPTTYSVNGTQYITTFVGGTGDLYAFALS
jgi:quinohemoprotein ethanol dehydrogenase